jgi:ribosomal protein S18 acetylase RimI-like enzyme
MMAGYLMTDFYEESNRHSPIRILGKIKRFIFTTNSAIWFEQDLTKELTEYQVKIPIEFDTSSTNQTIEWLKRQEQSWLVHPKEISVALEYNHFWPSVRANGKIIGCVKIGFGNVYIADYDKVIELPEKMAFIYDTYILPEQRGKGVAKYLKSQVLKFLKAKGFNKVGSHVPPWNKAMISINEKMGIKKVSYIRYFKIFGISIRIASHSKDFSIFKGGKILQEDIPFA